jgi:LPS-assembly lipoprotein|tara:strand:+ start:1707 stop:2225 length:519 start_codon:yes stop_codon:yes gene_type:complete
MWSFKALAISLISLTLFISGCGFQPLYQHDTASHNILKELSLIRIAPIEDRIGQQLRNFLQDDITPRGKPTNPSYELIVKMNKTRRDLVLLQDATSTFAKISLHAAYTLTNFNTGATLTSGNVTAKTGFTIAQSEYANIRAETEAASRASREISYDITRQLALFLKKTTSNN